MKPVALITGGQKGIGLGIAHALVENGYRVALAADSAPDSVAVRDALAELGEDARYFQHDLRDIAAVDRLLDQIEADCGPVASLVSNAGVPAKLRGDLLNLTQDSYDFVMDVNLKGAFFLAQAVAQRMLASPASANYRSIVFVTSVSAAMVSIERGEYCLSKAGAAMMVQLFAARLAEDGIGVFELRPGIIETDMTAGVKDAYTPRIEGGLVPAKRWGIPSDIASIVVPLVRGKMAFANGAIIPVDGGLSIHRL
ncbi:3-ketoacyl-ACP reductase [Falsihalocynthiibacter sp. S25ZX9]|uniref:3-ketoacyl-ACP reductase n=1 Tax=Falsihalocynthiibacter sp. S25ZX9 TaxID=3240870 RepID=UPI00350E92D9